MELKDSDSLPVSVGATRGNLQPRVLRARNISLNEELSSQASNKQLDLVRMYYLDSFSCETRNLYIRVARKKRTGYHVNTCGVY